MVLVVIMAMILRLSWKVMEEEYDDDVRASITSRWSWELLLWIHVPTDQPAPAAADAWQVSLEKAHPWAYAHQPRSHASGRMVKMALEVTSQIVRQPVLYIKKKWVSSVSTLTLSLSNSSKGTGAWSTWSLLKPRAYKASQVFFVENACKHECDSFYFEHI